MQFAACESENYDIKNKETTTQVSENLAILIMSSGSEIIHMSRVDWRARQLCKYCEDLEHSGSHENTILLCDCCVATGAHVKCLAEREGKVITPEQINCPAFIWFCSPVRKFKKTNIYFITKY